MTSTTRVKCRLCGHCLNAWLPAAHVPDGARLLGHLGQQHRGLVKPSLDRMHTTDDITPVIVEAYEVVEDLPAGADQT